MNNNYITVNASGNVGLNERELADMFGDRVLAKLASFRAFSLSYMENRGARPAPHLRAVIGIGASRPPVRSARATKLITEALALSAKIRAHNLLVPDMAERSRAMEPIYQLKTAERSADDKASLEAWSHLALRRKAEGVALRVALAKHRRELEVAFLNGVISAEDRASLDRIIVSGTIS